MGAVRVVWLRGVQVSAVECSLRRLERLLLLLLLILLLLLLLLLHAGLNLLLLLLLLLSLQVHHEGIVIARVHDVT